MSKIPIPQGPELTGEKKEFDLSRRISEGFHAAVLIDLEHYTTPNSHKDYVRAEFEIDDDGVFLGRHVSTNVFLTLEARWRLNSFLAALGHDVATIAFFDSDELIGRRCKIRVKYSDENPYPDVTKFRAIRSAPRARFAESPAPAQELDDDQEEDDRPTK